MIFYDRLGSVSGRKIRSETVFNSSPDRFDEIVVVVVVVVFVIVVVVVII
jgi:hypothetical protein